ncbi:MAG: YabP/YqfC family sporulation protein [Lachnospiraceae bacterium]|nr:YabP/YqfC family sporulation protein [Lachnospiraceae bacterium]
MTWQNSTKPEHEKNRKKENGGLYKQLKEQEKREKQERLSFLEVLSESISLPPDVLAGAPIVTMHGRNAVYIENHKKITEYSEEHILIQTKSCKLAIEGKRLKIDYFTKEELKISGLIRRISYGEEA